MLHRKRIASVILTFILCMGLALQVQASNITDAQNKAKELEKQKDTVEAEKNSLTEQLNTVVGEMTEVQEKVSAKEGEIQKKEEELVQAKVDENNQYESMKKRIQYMYENGDAEFIEILCESKSIGEFLNNAEYITTLSKYDRAQLNEFQKVVKAVKKQEEDLKEEYEELTDIRDDLIEKQEAVETLLASADIKLSDIEQQIGDNAAVLEKLMAEAEAAAARQQALQNAQTGGSSYVPAGPSVVTGNGQFTNPCPGASYISSYFGEYRSPSDPSHKGMDYAAGTGTPTYAAAAGTVVIAGWSDSAGNWVVINHGNGITTKYMHHSALSVSAGQTVAKGQQIGLVGSTGWSTGAHLHFQVEVNGVAVDPRNYL